MDILTFFARPNMVRDIKSIIEGKFHTLPINVINTAAEVKSAKHSLMITDYQQLQLLELCGLDEIDFKHLIIIDEVLDSSEGNTTYLNIKNYSQTLIDTIAKFLTPRAQTQDMSHAGFSVLQKFFTDLGFEEALINYTYELHQKMQIDFNQEFMQKVFIKMKKMEESFLFSHSYLAAVVGLTVGKAFSWMSYENREKFYLACMIHDLGFKDQEHIKFEMLTRDEILQQPNTIQTDIFHHATRLAEKLKNISAIPKEVITIVEHHHSIYAHDSYPRQIYPTDINPMFVLFILSHDFASAFFRADCDTTAIPSVLDDIEDRYLSGKYLSIFPEFRARIEGVFAL